MKKREVVFTFEEIIEVYEPSNPSSRYSKNSTVDCVKIVKGYATLGENDEVEYFLIDEVKIDDRKITKGQYKEENENSVKSLFKKLFAISR